MNQTLKTVLNGLFYRLESMSKTSHPGWWNDQSKHRNAIDHVRSRIMDVIANQYPDEDSIPEVLHVTYDHTIYRVDYVQGTLKAIGAIPRHLPCETELLTVLEVG